MAIKYVNRGAVAETNAHLRSAATAAVRLDLLDETSVRTLVTATARILGLETSAVSVVNEYLIEEVNGISRVGVVLRILAQKSDFPELSFSSPAEIFASVTTLLTTSIASGSFDTTIAAAAIEFQAAELLQAVYDTAAEVPKPTYTEIDTYDPMDAGLSTGEYAGIVIGVLVAFIVLIGCVWFAVKRRSEESAGMPTDHV